MDALKELGDVLAKQSQAALAGGKETIKSNESVADSYAGMGGSVRDYVVALKSQAVAQANSAEAAAKQTLAYRQD